MTSDLNEYLENIIDDLGGLGRFQWILIIIVLGSEISVAWSTLMMTFGGAVPEWHCNWKTVNGVEYTTNTTHWIVCELENTTVPINLNLYKQFMIIIYIIIHEIFIYMFTTCTSLTTVDISGS
jgi:hypothetical protein